MHVLITASINASDAMIIGSKAAAAAKDECIVRMQKTAIPEGNTVQAIRNRNNCSFRLNKGQQVAVVIFKN